MYVFQYLHWPPIVHQTPRVCIDVRSEKVVGRERLPPCSSERYWHRVIITHLSSSRMMSQGPRLLSKEVK